MATLEELYNALKSDGAPLPETYEKFATYMTSGPQGGYEHRKKVYDALKADGAPLPDTYDAFSKALFAPVTKQGNNALGSQESKSIVPAVSSGANVSRPKKGETPAFSMDGDTEWKLTAQQKAAMMGSVQSVADTFKAQANETLDRSRNIAEYTRRGGGITGQPVEGDGKVNPETGQVEKTYITPTGAATRNKSLAERDTRAYNDYADSMTIAGQLRRASRELDDLNQKILKRTREISSETSSSEGKPFFYNPGFEKDARLKGDSELKTLEAARRQVEERIGKLGRKRDAENGEQHGYWRGFLDVLSDINTWGTGEVGLHDTGVALDIDNKINKGEKLTDSENRYMSARMENDQTDAKDGWMYRMGLMTGEMIPFMLDFSLMGGAQSGATGISKALTGYLERKLPSVAANKVGKWSIKVLGTMPEDLLIKAPTMSNTVQAGATLEDIASRKLGDVTKNEDGTYDFSNDKSWGSAIWQGEANSIIENYSEMFGTHLEGALSLKAASKVADVFGAKRISGLLTKASSGELAGIAATAQKQLNRLGVSDYFGEVGEEYYGQLWRTILNLDDAKGQDNKNLFLDPQFHADIWGGMALSMGMIGAGKYTISAAAYGSMKHRVNKSDRRAAEIFTPEIWDGWRERIDGTTNDDIADVAASIYADPQLNKKQRDAAMDYMEASLNLRGFNLASVARQRGGEESPEEMAVNENYMDGYSATEPEEMNDVRLQMEQKRDILVGSLGEDAVAEIEEDPIAGLRKFSYDETLHDSLSEFVNARMVYDGMIQRVRDDIDGRIAQSDTMIENRINSGTGMIQPATVRDANSQEGRQVYIVDGNVAMFDDGSGVDIGRSSKSIIIRDAESGKAEFASPDQFLSVSEGVDADEEKESARQQIRQEIAQRAADNIDGVISFDPGRTYPILDSEGNQTEITILQQSADEDGLPAEGMVDIQLADGTVLYGYPMNKLESEINTARAERVGIEESVRGESDAAEQVNEPVSVISRIPVDDKGEPDYDQVEPDLAWDALLEQTEGDADMARGVIEQTIAEKEEELKKILKQRPQTGLTVAQKIQAAKEQKSLTDGMRRSIDHWKSMAGTIQRREAEADAIRREEAARQKEENRVKREAERAAQEEAERIEREALNGVPDWSHDSPKDARSRGFRRVGPEKVDRQENVAAAEGKEVEVKFADNELVKGHAGLIEADALQPSHIQGSLNPLHFISEGQPKNREDAASVSSAARIAGNIRPEEITSSVTAYTGAPTVNRRGETIQGNSRSDALRLMYESYPEQAAKYKQYLVDHAADFGLDAGQVASMERPVLVNMLDVDDNEAIRLGQFVAQDTESGGTERIKPTNMIQKMGEEMSSFSNILLRADDDEASVSQLIDANGADTMQWLARKGHITETQYQSAFDSKGNLTPEAKNDLQGMLYENIFTGGSTQLKEMFGKIPVKAQRAILATAHRDRESGQPDRIKEELQQSIMAFNDMMNYPDVADATDLKSAIRAVDTWSRQYAFDEVTGESHLPSKNFSNFALRLAALYRGGSQKLIQQTFNDLFDSVHGTELGNLFEEADRTPKSLGEAIGKVLGIEYQPINRTENGNNGSDAMDIDTPQREAGRPGGEGDAGRGERAPEGEGLADGGRGTSQDSGASYGERISAAEGDVNIAPSDAQKEAGNYRKGHVRVGKFDISIENPKGSVRRGTDANGKEWETTMTHTYGYIRGTKGVDGDHIDVYISSDVDGWDGQRAFVVDQYNPDGTFDEHKVMLGFNSREDAFSAYLSNYERGWEKGRRLDVTPVNIGDFEKWIDSSKRKTKPFAEYARIKDGEGVHSLLDVVRDLYSKGKEYASKLYQMKFFDMAKTPDFMKELGLTGEKFTIRYGVIARHVGKDGSHDISEAEWGKLPDALTKPFAITKLKDKDKGFRLYTALQNSNGEYIVVGADVKNAGRNLEVNSIATVFGRRENAGLTLHEEVIYTDEKITPEQKSLLNGPNFRQYPSEGELNDDNMSSERKDNTLRSEKQGDKEKSSEGYTISAKPYTNRQGKTLDTYLVIFDRDFSRQEKSSLRAMAKGKRGWADKETGGWMLRSRDDAEAFAKAVMSKNDAQLSEEAPLSLEDMQSAIEQAPAEISDGNEEISSSEPTTMTANVEKSVSPADKPADAVGRQEKKTVNPSGNRLVTDEQYADLLARMRRKMGGQLNMGVDPEILAIGSMMAVYHIEKGARKFAEYVKAMAADLGEKFPARYLKGFYKAAHEMIEDAAPEIAEEMDSDDVVNTADVASIISGHTDAMATAEMVVGEERAGEEQEEAERRLKEDRNVRLNPDGSTTETIKEGGVEIEVTKGDFIPGVRPFVEDSNKAEKRRSASSKPSRSKPVEQKAAKAQLDLFGEEDRRVINDIAEETRLSEPKPEGELSGDSGEYQDRRRQERDLVDDIVIEIMTRADMKAGGEDKGQLTMRDVRGMLENYDRLTDISATDLQELVERAMTILTRTTAKAWQGDPRKGYDRVVAYYNAQPSLNARDSERLMKQQYSTPTPFGYVMGQFVNAGHDVRSVLEPSAGNGALTIMFDPSAVHVNDIDERRLENLRALGYGEVTARNGLLPFEGDRVDAVMTNPPFGTVTEREYDGIFKISSLEGQMAINALDSMKDDGRAAIIIGGNTNYRTNGSMNPKDAAFFGYLYSHYNVADVINISGKALYARSGTGYDVRMILINGRKTGEFSRDYPPVKSKARAEQVTTFDELYKRVEDDIQQVFQMGRKPADEKSGSGRPTDRGTSAPVGSGNNRTNQGAGERPDATSNGIGGASGPAIEQPVRGNGGSRPVGMDNGDRGNARGTDDVPESKSPTSGSDGGGSPHDDGGRGGSVGRNAASSRPNNVGERLAVKPDLTTEKVPYPNQSDNGFTLLSVVPAAQAEVLQRSLGEIGDVDQFLVDELGYSSKEELYSFLAAEQIDSVALAIHQMNKGNAFIIGDMTGVGKGRQGAALIRYGVRQGKCPIYFTQKPTLFTDNYRDLADIGSSELRPFIIASNPKDANIVDANGNIVHKLPSKKEQERVFNYIMQNGKLPEEYDYVLTTYDQIKNGTADYTQNEDGTWNTEARKLPKKSKGYTTADYNGQMRRDALARLAMGISPGKGNIAILDESHTVGGDSGCGRYMQMLTSGAHGVTFLSATFAKRADNMPIYAQRTAISEAGVKANELIEAIAKGGVTLQEIMSKQLVESGQMIRRERSFEGVTIDWLSVDDKTDRKQREQFNEVADIFNSIRNFQNDFIKPIIDGMNEDAAEQGATVGQTQGTKDLGVRNTPFASKMYNLVNQLLFALKVDAVADRVIENLRNGFKPVISFTNTMEGFLASAPKGVAMDEMPNFSLTLMRALDGVMRFTENDADQNSEGGQITVGQLSPEGQAAYNAVKDKIMNLSADLPISPMDAIRMKIEEAGYNVAEITGRTTQLNRTEDGRYIVEGRKDRDKKAAMRDFNSGKLDVLMINKSGSTGISLHASSKFEDQRQRVMVFAQFQSDINDEVQMRGRIDRSGQVVRGRYEYIMSTIPAEQRIQMMFKAKLKSLDANTTSSQKSKFNEMEIVDYLNKYGDEVVWEYMKEHPELSDRLGDPLKMLKEKDEDGSARTSDNEDTSLKSDCAGKISRYLAFLSVDEQDEIFREITEAYKVKIQLLDDAGENDLEITTMPLKAETKSKQIWHSGENPGSGNAFADNTYVEEVEVDVLKKPMKRTEIEEMTRKLMGDKVATATEYDQMRYGMKEGELNWNRYADTMINEINKFFSVKVNDALEKMKESGANRVSKAREKAVKDALKARGKGENTFNDQEIEAIADVVAKEAQDKEDLKQLKRQNEINAVRDHIKHLLSRLRAGHIYVVPQDLKQATADMFTQTFGTFVGFKFNKSYTLGSSTAIFATLDGRRKVELALNDKAIETIIRCTDTALRYSPREINAISMDNWDSKVPTQTRQKRYIITGNLLQALVDTEKGERTRGNLISFSTKDGNTRQGILMSENFKPTDLRSSVPLRSRLKQIEEGKTVVSENGEVQIERISVGWEHRGDFELRVPKSKQRGGIYTMNPELLRLVEGHNFVSKGNSMVGYILPENLAKVVDMLSHAPFNLTVLEESKLSEANEDVRYRLEEDIESVNDQFNNELEEQIRGNLPPGHIYSLGHPGEILLSTGVPDYPIQMSASRLRAKSSEYGHDFDLEEVKNLVMELRQPIAVFSYGNKDKAQNIIVGIESNGKQFIVGLSLSPTVGGKKLEINSIRNVFPKNNAEWLNWISQDKLLWADKEKIQGLIDKQRTILADVEYLDLDDIAKIVKSFENPTIISSESLEREGIGAYSDAEVSFENDPWSKAWGESIRTKRQQKQYAERERKRMRERAESLSQTLGVDIEVLEDASALKGKKQRAKGWYDTKTGKITVVISNHNSAYDMEATILHEAVAHHGLRELLGEHFDEFLDKVYEAADNGIKEQIDLLASRNGWNRRIATEEYLAGLAERTDFDRAEERIGGWFDKIKQFFIDMLFKAGFKHIRPGSIGDNELRYILWRSYQNLANPGRYRAFEWEAEDVAMQYKLQVGPYEPISEKTTTAADEDVRFRDGDFIPRDRALAAQQYEQMLKRGSWQFREATQDSMLGLKTLYESILGKGTRIEEVAGYENAYLYENRMSSANNGEQHQYFSRFMKPLLESIHELCGSKDLERRILTDYMIAKHGLERNEYMRNEAAANGEETERDFAGLCGLTGEGDWQLAEAAAQQMVDDYESDHDTTELWGAVKDATTATLEKIYLSGLISEDTYNSVLGMYDYYIPLRGWDETTSDEVYGYLTSKDGPLMGNVFKTAEGRRSKADDPVATIAMMADDAIRQGNRNIMKQRFLNFAQGHPSDLVSVNEMWLQHNDVTDEWEPVFADLQPDMTSAEVESEIAKFEAKMEALRNSEPDKYKRGRDARNIPYKVVRGNLNEHQVLVKRNGRTYVMTINGNPRAAQALNGLTNPNVETGGVIGNMLKLGEYVNRHLSAFYTTRNPDFVVSNFLRDMLYSNCMTWVKENPRYALRFHRNFGRVNPATLRGLLSKWESNTLSDSIYLEKMFRDFMLNGGETGYTTVKDIDGHKRTVAKELKKQGSVGRKAWCALGMQLDLLNRSVENCARFAAFLTSREMGRSLDRSIYDAKEISVNFNKKGSGGKFVNATGQKLLGKIGSYLGGGGRIAFVFWNAGIQGMTNFGRAARRNPGKAIGGAAALFTLGYVIPLLAQMLGGGDGDDDDRNAYYNLPEYVRRSNICLKAGEQWITIPLPIEYRAIYGMGELACGVISGNERYGNSELARQMAAQISQIMPLDMLEGGGGISPFIPSAFKPMTEAYIMNKGWTGLPVYKDSPFNKNDPEWTKAYQSTDQHLVAFSKWLNETSGGDDYKKGSIDINPAKIEYLLSGTFGGLVSTTEKLKKMGETAFSDREFEWRNMLLANRVIKSGDERTANRKLQNEYFKYKEESEETGRLLRKYENAADGGILGYAEKADFLYNSPEYLRYEIFQKFKEDIDAINEELKGETDAEVKKGLQEELYGTMRELVDSINGVGKEK